MNTVKRLHFEHNHLASSTRSLTLNEPMHWAAAAVPSRDRRTENDSVVQMGTEKSDLHWGSSVEMLSSQCRHQEPGNLRSTWDLMEILE